MNCLIFFFSRTREVAVGRTPDKSSRKTELKISSPVSSLRLSTPRKCYSTARRSPSARRARGNLLSHLELQTLLDACLDDGLVAYLNDHLRV